MINDLRELSNRVNLEKITFIPKIYYCLKFVSLHPEHAKDVGIEWVSHDIFRANSTVLARFLNLKQNSINTNFRDHQMNIINDPSLVDDKSNRQWSFRSVRAYKFNQLTTEEEALQIKIVTDVLPSEFKTLIRNVVDTSAENRARMIVAKMDMDSSLRLKLLTSIAQLWSNLVGKYSSLKSAPISVIAPRLHTDPTLTRRVAFNLLHIAREEDNASYPDTNFDINEVMSLSIDFFQFFRYFVRYGNFSDPFKTVRDLTDSVSVIEVSPLSEPGVFIPGFHINLTKNDAYATLSSLHDLNPRSLKWILSHSKNPLNFKLWTRKDTHYSKFAIESVFDEHLNRVYRVHDMPRGYNNSLVDLLFQTLNLKPSNGVSDVPSDDGRFCEGDVQIFDQNNDSAAHSQTLEPINFMLFGSQNSIFDLD